MFRAVLYSQWKWCRWIVLFGTIAAFAVPVLSVRQLGRPSPEVWQVSEALRSVQAWGMWYPMLAFLITGLLSAYTWQPDIVGKHVYALSLPIPRWHYVLLRLGAGLVLLAAPIAAVWVGSLAAVSAATIPSGLHAYPHALTFRFALILAVLMTTISGLTAMPKRIQMGIGIAFLVLIGAEVLTSLAGAHVPFFTGPMVKLFEWPGPFQLLIGRWALVDV